MHIINSIVGKGFHLPGSNIDTDRIIPARFMKCLTFDELGPHVFADDRAAANGQHPFDRPENQGANMLIVDHGFGNGSSREHAPQALKHWGIQAIIGLSFADIFRGNCTSIGLPCVTVGEDEHQQLAAQSGSLFELSLYNGLVVLRNPKVNVRVGLRFTLPNGVRDGFLNGTWDNLGILQSNVDAVHACAKTLPEIHQPEGVVS